MGVRLVTPPTLAHTDPQQSLLDLISLPAGIVLSDGSVSVRARRTLAAHLPPTLPLPVYRWKKGVPRRAGKRARSFCTGHVTFEEDKSSISPFIGCIYAGGQAFPELLDLHGVALLYPVIAQAPEPAILGVKARKERGIAFEPSDLSPGAQAPTTQHVPLGPALQPSLKSVHLLLLSFKAQ